MGWHPTAWCCPLPLAFCSAAVRCVAPTSPGWLAPLPTPLPPHMLPAAAASASQLCACRTGCSRAGAQPASLGSLSLGQLLAATCLADAGCRLGPFPALSSLLADALPGTPGVPATPRPRPVPPSCSYPLPRACLCRHGPSLRRRRQLLGGALASHLLAQPHP